MASFEVRSVAGNMSRRSSIATIPPSFEGAHRLDLLIEEQVKILILQITRASYVLYSVQKAAVKNTQDGLKQSLAILKQANSKVCIKYMTIVWMVLVASGPITC